MRLRTRDGWLAAATLAGFVLVALAARARPEVPRATPPVARPSPRETMLTISPAREGPPREPPRSHMPHLWLPWWAIQWLLIGVLLLAAIAIVVALWPQLRARARYGRARRRLRPVEPAPDDLIRQVSSTLRATMAQVADGQIRDGVILCWRRLEQTAEAAGLRRSPADTSSDLAGRLLASMPLSEAPLNRLAALYREARFSSHPIPREAVAQARADLAQLRAELETAAGLGAGHG